MEPLLRQIKQRLEEAPGWTKDATVVLGVSGGVDSMVLWRLLTDLFEMREYQEARLVICHYNHHLRSSSDEEAHAIEQLAKEYGQLYFVGHWEEPSQTNVEAQARKHRYQFFADVCQMTEADVLMTGHHLQDAVETFLMRLVRGTSLKGIQGMRYDETQLLTTSQDQGLFVRVMRPLEYVQKEDLYRYAEDYHLVYFEDQSNTSDRFLRNRIRHQWLPLLEAENPQFMANWMELQTQLQASYQVNYAWYQTIEPQIVACLGHKEWYLNVIEFLKLSSDHQVTFLNLWFEERLVTDLPHYSKAAIGSVHQLIQATDEPNAVIDLGSGWQAQRQYEWLKIVPPSAPKEPLQERVILDQVNRWYQLSETESLGWFEKRAVSPLMRHQASAEWAVSLPEDQAWHFTLRHRQPGDEMVLNDALGHPFHKKVARLMIDLKIPLIQRSKRWLLCNEEDEVVWLIPETNSRLYQPTKADRITHIFLYQKEKQAIEIERD